MNVLLQKPLNNLVFKFFKPEICICSGWHWPNTISAFCSTVWRCHFAGQRASLVFFAAPIIVINIVNAGLVSVTMYRIRRHKRSMKGVRVNPGAKGSPPRDGSKQEVSAFVRIGSVFGFTWIFGIVAGFVMGQADKSTGSLLVYEVLIYSEYTLPFVRNHYLFFLIIYCSKEIARRISSIVSWLCRRCVRWLARSINWLRFSYLIDCSFLVFIFTQATQGFLIFLAFGMNAKVRAKLVALIKSRLRWTGCKACEAKICRCAGSSASSTITTSVAASDSFN